MQDVGMGVELSGAVYRSIKTRSLKTNRGGACGYNPSNRIWSDVGMLTDIGRCGLPVLGKGRRA
jgi:hypothetical protein